MLTSSNAWQPRIKTAAKIALLSVFMAVITACSSTQLTHKPFSFVALGDTAYNIPKDYPIYESLISNVNQQRPAFTIHLGDLWGYTPCTNDAITRQKQYFDRFEQPLIYTPGDNEWTDCNRNQSGDFLPLDRLALIRKTFFADLKSLGRNPILLQRQSLDPKFKVFVENARWQYEDVLFTTVHVVGSKNNKDMKEEFTLRTKANTAWLKAFFSQAKTSQGKGSHAVNALVIAIHGDMFDHKNKVKPAYKKTAKSIIAGALALDLPVLLVHGDSHQFIVDNPFKKAPNVTRLQVYGAPDIKAVKINVDTSAVNAFDFSAIDANPEPVSKSPFTSLP